MENKMFVTENDRSKWPAGWELDCPLTGCYFQPCLIGTLMLEIMGNILMIIGNLTVAQKGHTCKLQIVHAN